MRTIKIFLATLALCISSGSQAACPDGELRFSFDNLPLRTAFVLMADNAGMKVTFRDMPGKVAPVKFPCTPWRQAVEGLAEKHGLSVRIEGKTLHVSGP